MNKLIRSLLRNFKPYDSYVAEGSICLNANENPYPLSSAYGFPINRYPEGQPHKLCGILADLYGADENEIVITSGADQAIDLLIRTFIDPGDGIIVTPPTFSMYEFYTAVQGGTVWKVPLNEDDNYALDVESIIDRQKESGAKIVFIINPSAPLGHVQKTESILAIIKALRGKAMVVVDEAYIEFSDIQSFVKYRRDYTNLIILRTLSKYYGFAGLRLGSMIASKEVANTVKAIAPPYSLSAASIKIAEDLLSSNEMRKKAEENKKRIISMRTKVSNFLLSLPFVKKVFPSDTNYVFFTVDDANDLKKFCAGYNYLIRSLSSQYKGGVRLSIGTDEQMQELFDILEKYKNRQK